MVAFLRGPARTAGIFSSILLLACCLPARGQDTSQFHLASQFDWGAAKGFFLVVESSPHGNTPAQVQDAKLTLGVGDGHNWHFASGGSRLVRGKKYNVAAIIGHGSAQIELDGQAIAKINCGFTPASGQMLFDQPSNVMHAAADYQVIEQPLHVESDGTVRELQSTDTGVPPQLLLLNPAIAAQGPDVKIGDSVTVRTIFEFGPRQSLRSLSPFIDPYGQCVQAEWPGKIRSDEDLKSAQKLENEKFAEWGLPDNRDPFGGVTNAPWHEEKAGFFRVAKHDEKWWLITPNGNPCFYIGLCNAPAYVWEDTPVTGREYLFSWLPPHEGTFGEAWVNNAWHINDGLEYFCFHTANMIREFGDDWKNAATASAVRRVHMLGFSGFGKWSDGDLGVCDLPVLGNHGPNLVKHPDVFDAKVRVRIVQALRRQIEPRKQDPWLLGWSVGNEKDEDITADEIRQILKMDPSVPACKVLTQLAGSSDPDDATIEKLREHYERAYYSFLYKTVKSLDPNHLYFGNWVTPNWWENENDWKISAANCDVLGFDWYADHFPAEPAGRLIAENDKPILCGEFSFPPTYNGQRGFGTYGTHVATEAEAGQKYTQWIHDAASDPHCVGAFYFQYRDEPLTGRGPGNSRNVLVVGEDFAFGLVDVTDRIKWDFANQARQANLTAASIRLRGAGR